MTIAVAVTRTELDSTGLRRAAGRARDADAARRMLALALVLEGHSRTEAAGLCGMDRQTLRDWVHRYNDLGLPGLSDRVPPGSKPRLSPEQEAEVAKMVREEPALFEHHDAAAQEAHKKTLPIWLPPRSPSTPAANR